ncbi:MAG TPA: hypothetical protein VFV72_05775 [Candidatus Limnocylindrales bacterium]|nr:hypothetical protein [Candidatus Limnocylindrales bacterium]
MSGPNHIDLEPAPQPRPEPVPAPVPSRPQASQPPVAATGPVGQRRRSIPTINEFGVMAFVILAGAIVAFAALYFLPAQFNEGPGNIVILLVAGLVALTLLLYLGTIIHRTAGVGTAKGPLGMPDGSIRALIALSLILMFAIIGVTVLYAGMGTQEELVSKGITTQQINDLENVQIVSISVVDPNASPGTETYDVTVRPEISQAGHDFGLQLLTTVSTLVVAVAGFYFGAKAVSQGSKAALAAIPSPPPGPVVDGPAGSGGAAGVAPGSDGSGGGGATGGDEIDESDLIGAVEDGAAEDDGEGEPDPGAAPGAAAGAAGAAGAGGAAGGGPPANPGNATRDVPA